MRNRTIPAIGLLTVGLALTTCGGTSGGAGEATSASATVTGPTAPTSPRTPFVMPSHSPEPLSTLATDPETAACYKAIKDQYEPGTAVLTGEPTEPPACLDLTTDQVSEVAGAVVEDQFSG